MPIEKLYLIRESQVKTLKRTSRWVAHLRPLVRDIEKHELSEINRQLQQLLGDSENNGI